MIVLVEVKVVVTCEVGILGEVGVVGNGEGKQGSGG